MHTGYDSFWMYQNNRHEPLLNLQKNDNYSPAVLTDCYKQVQIGGHPGPMNSYVPPQNNVATSYSNSQQVSPYMWPSSVYSQPLKPSYVSNFHPQEAYSTQSNNLGYSAPYSQAQQTGLGYFKNSNTSVSEVCNNSNKNFNNADSLPTKDIHSADAQTPRIRVKDVFSLNNNTVSSEALNCGIYQVHQKKLHEPAPNYAGINHNTACNSVPLNDFVNYGKSNMSQSNHPSSYYQTAAREPPPYPQNPNLFYQRNTQPQLQFGANGLIQRNFNLEASQVNTADKAVPGNLLNTGNNQERNIQSDSSSESFLGKKRVEAIPKRNCPKISNLNVINNSGFVNKRLVCQGSDQSSVPNIQSQLPEKNLFRNNTSTAVPDLNGSAGDRLNFPSNNNKNNDKVGPNSTVIKISIPHKGQSTYLTVSNCDSTNESCSLSLPTLLESSDEALNGWKENSPARNNPVKANASNNNSNAKENVDANVSVAQTGLSNQYGSSTVNHVISTSPNGTQNSGDANAVYRPNSTVPPRKRFCRVVEPFIDVNKENVEEFLNSNFDISVGNFGSKVSGRTSSSKKESVFRETIFQNDITQNALMLKQENFNSRAESPDRDISEGSMLLGSIKIEGGRDDDSLESPTTQEYEDDRSGESSTLGESLTSTVEVTESIEFSKANIQKFLAHELSVPEPETPPGAVEHTQHPEGSTSSEKKKDSSGESALGGGEKSTPSRRNYKSKINRDKLDKLIQFLEKDEEPGGPSDKEKKGENSQRKKKLDLNHNRRKLSKTCIVKNKNNSREMVSMVSHKNSRVEASKCSPQIPQIVKPNPSPHKTGETKAKCTEDKTKADECVNRSDKHETSNPTPESLTQGTDCSKSEAKDRTVTEHSGETSNGFASEWNRDTQRQQNIINTIRALQILETMFCRRCNSVSTLDSFWINLVSGELRCLNCFKKMTINPDESTLTSSTNAVTGSEMKNAEDEREKGSESVLSEANKPKELSRVEHVDVSSKNCKQEPVEPVESTRKYQTTKCAGDGEKNASGHGRTETVGSPKTPRRQSSSTEDRFCEKGKSGDEQPLKTSYFKEENGRKDGRRRDSVSKENHSAPKTSISNASKQLPDASERKHTSKEGGSKTSPCVVENSKKDQPVDQSIRRSISKEHNASSKSCTGKSEKTIRRSTSKEKENSEEHSRREKKGADCPNQDKKRRESKDNYCPKSPEENSRKEVKVDSTDKSVKRVKESHHRDTLPELTSKKTTQIEQPETGKAHSPPTESSVTHKSRVSEQTKQNSSDELKSKSTFSTHNFEKHKRLESVGQTKKRKNSDEDLSAVKIRVLEDHTKKDVKPVPHKTNLTSAAKQDVVKHKSKTTVNELQSSKNSADTIRRNSVTKEDGEKSKKEAKQVTDSTNSSKLKEVLKGDSTYQKLKAFEQTKQKGGESSESPRRKSKEEIAVKPREAFDVHRRKSTSKEEVGKKTEVQESSRKELKNESLASEKKKKEEIERTHSSGKTQKTEKDRIITSSEKPRKTDSRPLKENQNTKRCSTSAVDNGKYKNKDSHEDRREHKNNGEDRKEEKKKVREKETSVKSRDADGNSEKKNPSGGRCDKNQTENKQSKGSEKSGLGGKEEERPLKEGHGGDGGKHSALLLAKLIKKTKKLSWSLLSEA